MGRMGVSIYMKGYYEEIRAFGLRKNSLVGGNLFQVCDFGFG